MERNEKDITLILDRKNNDLWINTDDGHKAVIQDVTGVKVTRWAGVSYDIPMWTVMSHGKKIANVWDVKEIKEEW